MSKKKNKKKSKKRDLYYESYNRPSKKEKDKKKSKKNKNPYEKPEFKTRKISLKRDNIKKAKKIVSTKPKVDKDLYDIQENCNHAGELITVPEYKQICLTPSVYTPNLDVIYDAFGDKALICKSCYQVVVSPEAVDLRELKKATSKLYAAAMAVLPHNKYKNKEIRRINNMANDLSDWNEIINQFEKMSNKGVFKVNINTSSDDVVDVDLNQLTKSKAVIL